MSLVNVAIADTFVLRDAGDVALTGKVAADFATLEAYALPSGATTATVSLTEIGAGEYAVSFTPTTAAFWTVHIVYNSGGVFREFSQTYEVTTITSTVTAVSATAGLSLTRKQLRRKIAENLEDLFILTATSASSNAFTFVDSLNINGAAEHSNGRQLMFTGGTAGNLGLVRRVSATTDAENKLTFTPAATTAPQVGDEIELLNQRGKGFLFEQIHRAINHAINDAFPAAVIHAREEIATVFDDETPEVTVPATLYEVYGVEWADSNSTWHPLLKATRTNHTGWTADPAAGQLRIHGWPASHADTATIRLSGYGRQAELSADTDTCALNGEWITAHACYHLALGAAQKRDDLRDKIMLFRDEMVAMRPRLRVIRRSGSEKVRSI